VRFKVYRWNASVYSSVSTSRNPDFDLEGNYFPPSFFMISQQNSAWRKTVPQKKAHIDTNRADKGFFRLN